MGSSIIRIVVLTAAALSANAAHAICRGQPPAQAYVGSDAACDYSSIQSAITAASAADGCGTIINITPVTTGWINQSLQINGNKKLTLVGWGSGETCSHLKYCTTTGCTFNQNPRLPIKPAGGQSGLYVTGDSNDISVNNIEFTGGSLGSGHGGGGISFAGSGSLTLNGDTIDNNTAGMGGGIAYSGSGSLNLAHDVFVDSNTASSTDGGGIWVSPSATTTVTLGNNIHVTNNTAQRSGGGIFVQGDSTPGDTYLTATSPNLWIYSNHAPNGNGGGLFVGANALADIGSSGLSNVFPTIEQNNAAYGGGIAIAAPNTGCGSTTTRLFTTDSSHAVSVSGNSASHTGGGIYVQPEVGDCRNDAILCAENFSIDNNSAQEGAAIYADENGATPLNGGLVGLNVVDPSTFSNALSICKHSNVIAHGAVSCAAGVTCNEINGNVAQTASGTPTSGAAILMQTASLIYADRFSMRGNTGGKAIRVLTDGDGGAAELHNCLLAENTATEQLIEATPGGGLGFAMIIDSCTIAENRIGADHTIVVQLDDSGPFTLSNSIIAEPGLPTLDYQGNSGNLNVNYVLSNDVSTLSGIGIIKGGPNFIMIGGIGNPGDYHLQPYSLGVDYAPAGATSLDLDGKPRSVDLSDVPNLAGPMDIGAYEIQSDACSASDTIFCNGFEN